MKRMDGFNMITAILEARKNCNFEIVVVTGLDSIEVIERGLIPVDIPILSKPVDFQALLRIAEHIEASAT